MRFMLVCDKSLCHEVVSDEVFCLEDTLRLYLCNICNNTLIPLVSRGFGIIWILAFDIKIGLKYKTYFIFMVYQPEVLKNTNYFRRSI